MKNSAPGLKTFIMYSTQHILRDYTCLPYVIISDLESLLI